MTKVAHITDVYEIVNKIPNLLATRAYWLGDGEGEWFVVDEELGIVGHFIDKETAELPSQFINMEEIQND